MSLSSFDTASFSDYIGYVDEVNTLSTAFQDIGGILLMQRLDPILEAESRINAIAEILSYVWLDEDLSQKMEDAEFSNIPDPSYTDINSFIRQRNKELATRRIYTETARAIVFEINEIAKQISRISKIPMGAARVIAMQVVSVRYGGLAINRFYDPIADRINHDMAVAILKNRTQTFDTKRLDSIASKLVKSGFETAKDFMASHRYKLNEITYKLLDAYKNKRAVRLKESTLTNKLAAVLRQIQARLTNAPLSIDKIVLRNKYISLTEFQRYGQAVTTKRLEDSLYSIAEDLAKRMKIFETTSIQNARKMLGQIKATDGDLYFIRLASFVGASKMTIRYRNFFPDSLPKLIKLLRDIFNSKLDRAVCDYCITRHKEIRHFSHFLANPSDMPPSHPYCRCKLYPINSRYIDGLIEAGFKVDKSMSLAGGVVTKREFGKYLRKAAKNWLNPVVVGSVLVLGALAGVYIMRSSSVASKLSEAGEIASKELDIAKKALEPTTETKGVKDLNSWLYEWFTGWLDAYREYKNKLDFSDIDINTSVAVDQIQEAKESLRNLLAKRRLNPASIDSIFDNLLTTSNDAFVYFVEKIRPFSNLLELSRRENIAGQIIRDDIQAITTRPELEVMARSLFGTPQTHEDHIDLLMQFINDKLSTNSVARYASPEVKQSWFNELGSVIEVSRITIPENLTSILDDPDQAPFTVLQLIAKARLQKLNEMLSPPKDGKPAGGLFQTLAKINSANSLDELSEVFAEINAELNQLKELDNFFVTYLQNSAKVMPEKNRQDRITEIKNLFMNPTKRYLSTGQELGQDFNVDGTDFDDIDYLDVRNRLIRLINLASSLASAKLLMLLSRGAS